jgi:excisionase family DNA binding protein
MGVEMPVVGEDSLQLLTPTEAAELLRVSTAWIYSAATDGRLPCVRLGTRTGPLRFRRTELLAHIEAARAAWRPGMKPGAELRLVDGGEG